MDKWQDLIDIARAAITEGRTVTIKADEIVISTAQGQETRVTLSGPEITVE